MARPPRLATTRGIAVETTVDSMAPRKIDSITPITARRRRRSSITRGSVAAGAAGTATGGAQLRVRQGALVRVGPHDPQGGVELLDLAGPRRRRRCGRHVAAGAARTGRPQVIEGIDRAVTVGPVDAEGVAAHQMDVAGTIGIALAQDRDRQLLVH